ncbi:hypothetical protein VNO80_11711 [Phaseolus coccineus]|uniref:Uncharacterized protein n=1 Tax=Phaseolus coccineus TaxID=3886 RepID=A0AAN9NH05_PHACN
MSLSKRGKLTHVSPGFLKTVPKTQDKNITYEMRSTDSVCFRFFGGRSSHFPSLTGFRFNVTSLHHCVQKR